MRVVRRKAGELVTALCAPCHKEWLHWLDYRVRPRFQIHQVGDTAREVNDKRKGRYEDWRRTIRDQQTMIEASCERAHRPGQIALFEVAA